MPAAFIEINGFSSIRVQPLVQTVAIHRNPNLLRMAAIISDAFEAVGNKVVVIASKWIYVAATIVEGCDVVGPKDVRKRRWSFEPNAIHCETRPWLIT